MSLERERENVENFCRYTPPHHTFTDVCNISIVSSCLFQQKKKSCHIEKVEADSTTWWLADGVLVDDVTKDGPIQSNHISSTTLDEGELEINWGNGQYMPEIVDGDDDADSDATIELEERSDDGGLIDVLLNINFHQYFGMTLTQYGATNTMYDQLNVRSDEQNYDVNNGDDDNINNEAPMELNDEFFEYVDGIFRQFDDEELR
ncbi:hypothetical protein JTB14_029036 [Gonioctena quinquepunctata]|nr:hypothetical protein JTB14_029036 [Gonioctena quinquepunctata]